MTEHKIDDGREFIRLDGGWLRNMIDRFAAGTMSADAVLSELTASISADFWNSPRTWSLPAPPPDDVTAFLSWLVSMDDPESPEGLEARRTVTLTQIIDRARELIEDGD